MNFRNVPIIIIGLLCAVQLYSEDVQIKTIEQYRKAAAQGNVETMHALGKCYYNGDGVTKDSADAVK